MKKIVTAVLAAAVSCCLAFGLAACSDGEETGSSWGEEFSVQTAYAQAQELGYTGTLEEFIASISGKDGEDGEDGKDGEDGVGIMTVIINQADELVITLSNGNVLNLGVVVGADGAQGPQGEQGEKGEQGAQGPQGEQGTGVEDGYIDENGDLILVLTDGREINCGSVREEDTPSDGFTVHFETFSYCEMDDMHTVLIEEEPLPYAFETDIEFAGWYTDALLSEESRVTFPYTVTADVTLYARWVPADFLFELQRDGRGYSLVGYRGEEKSVTVPSEYRGLPVKSIEGAFEWNDALESVVLPDSLTNVGNSAFSDCSALKGIELPDGVTEIGYGAFRGCGALESVVLPDGVTEIGYGAFRGCGVLKTIDLEGVIRIGDEAFDGCGALVLERLPDSLTSIGINSFRECTIEEADLSVLVSLLSETSDGSSNVFRVIDLYVSDPDFTGEESGLMFQIKFYGTENIYFGCSVADWAGADRYFISIDNGGADTVWYFNGEPLGSTPVIPEGIERIGSYAFAGSSIEKIEIPFGVTEIGDGAFASTENLISVDLPGSVTEIGEDVFISSAITEIKIPGSVTEIGKYAFQMTELEKIYYGGTADEWSEIQIGEWSDLNYAGVYYYSEEDPFAGGADNGNYWHYVDGEIVVWTKQSV